jgi:hypothetical protein
MIAASINVKSIECQIFNVLYRTYGSFDAQSKALFLWQQRCNPWPSPSLSLPKALAEVYGSACVGTHFSFTQDAVLRETHTKQNTSNYGSFFTVHSNPLTRKYKFFCSRQTQARHCIRLLFGCPAVTLSVRNPRKKLIVILLLRYSSRPCRC